MGGSIAASCSPTPRILALAAGEEERNVGTEIKGPPRQVSRSGADGGTAR